MSDALSRLVQRVVAPETVVRPRLPFFFEPEAAEPAGEIAPAAALPPPAISERVRTVERERETHSEIAHETLRETHERVATHESHVRESAREIVDNHSVLHRVETAPRFRDLAPSAAPPPLPRNVIAAARAVQPVRAATKTIVEQRGGEEPRVEISIGRIDVRAVTVPQTSPQPRERAERRGVLTLEQYIEQRRGR